MDINNILENLCQTPGISGFEDKVRQEIRKKIEKNADSLSVDKMGNLIAIKKSHSNNAKKLLVTAHMDEIGLMVKNIEKSGLIRFVKVGGIRDFSLLYQEVMIHASNRDILGFICLPHNYFDPDKKKEVKYTDLFIDIGATSKDEVLKLDINIGTPITFKRNFLINGDVAIGKSFDNRAGCTALVDLFNQIDDLDNIDFYAVWTVQEEVGIKGASTAAFSIEPDLAVVFDVTYSTDFPGFEEKDSVVKMGQGPAVTVADGKEGLSEGLITPRKILNLIIEVAKETKISYQLDIVTGGRTDASVIQLSKEGILTGGISIPSRYIHMPSQGCCISDIKNTAKLTKEIMKKLDENMDFWI